jgi:putative ubiquitin-RnfH superfamily antitoxin RatB of RatAB toxin-antitoxin module
MASAPACAPPGPCIEIVHAHAGGVVSVRLGMPPAATVADALEAARALPPFSHLDLDAAMAGIFGRPVGRGQPLRDGDRVEIHACRALDPKLARRARARGKGLSSAKGAGARPQ